ncbi:hypothetical protein [Harryflintia acetispora]|uniref:Uncharacterized protein n=1 Tax=Harryflintia acetispora TaxID=1849041 RepID=A0A9X8UIZ4_9FIRM|nr:hypothetical protein [Harryflintia acetispora]TCL43206.1 hypothetical protein EDD78_10666 [Harryflintia acetispora]
MSELISIVEYAAMHGKHRVTVSHLAVQGRFKTAQKIGRNWVIDKNEPYPEDQRAQNGRRPKEEKE